MDISKKVAYLKGLAEGLDISSDSKNGKIIKGILDVLEDMAESVESLEEDNEYFEDYITEIDDDLGQLEEDFEKTCGYKLYKKENDLDDTDEFGDELEDFEDYEYFEDNDDEEEDILADGELLDGIVEIKCPKCGRHIFVETDDLLDSDYINCTECGEDITVINEMKNGEGCSCGHCHNLDSEDQENKSELEF